MDRELIDRFAALLAESKVLARTNPEIAIQKLTNLAGIIERTWPLSDDSKEGELRANMRVEIKLTLVELRSGVTGHDITMNRRSAAPRQISNPQAVAPNNVINLADRRPKKVSESRRRRPR